MDFSGNLDSLPFLQYETSMTPNDVRQENHSTHLTQNYDTSQQPPGAEVASHTTFTFPGQAEPSLQNSLPPGHINLEGDASRMLTQFSVDFHGHEQEAGLYPPSPPSSDSSPAYMSHLRASIPRVFYLFPNWVTVLRRDLRPLGPTVPKPRYPGKSILSSRSNPLSLFVSASIDAHTIPTRRWCILRCWYGRTRTSSRIFRDPIYCDATLPPTLAGSPYPLRTAASWLARNT